MRFKFLHLIFVIAFASLPAFGQIDPRTGEEKEEMPKGIKESLAKQRIEREKKDFAELLSRGEEAVKISDELEKSFSKTNQLSGEDRKKLDRLEKIVKKIRNEIGAGDDGDSNIEADKKPTDVLNAIKTLQSGTVKLVDELKKSSRYSVSVVAVESSNLLLKVVKFLRLGKN